MRQRTINHILPNVVTVDYHPSTQLLAVQRIELDLLKRLLEVCKRNDLQLWAYSGTLLGAIRHRGFIPWDDDIDVVMMRKDYDRLLQIAPNEFEEPYFFQSAYTDRQYIFGHAQLRNSKTAAIIDVTKDQPYNQGIFIDIFVLDDVENQQKANRIGRITSLMSKAMYWKYCWRSAKPGKNRLLAKLYSIVMHIFPHLPFYRFMEYLSRHSGTGDSRYITNLMFAGFTPKKVFYSDDYAETIYVDFDGIQMPIPAGYDRILRTQFGDDYMTPLHDPSMHGQINFDTEHPYTYYTRSPKK